MSNIIYRNQYTDKLQRFPYQQVGLQGAWTALPKIEQKKHQITS